MNMKISVFVTCVEAIIYLLLYNLHDCTLKKDNEQNIIWNYFDPFLKCLKCFSSSLAFRICIVLTFYFKNYSLFGPIWTKRTISGVTSIKKFVISAKYERKKSALIIKFCLCINFVLNGLENCEKFKIVNLQKIETLFFMVGIPLKISESIFQKQPSGVFHGKKCS